MAKLRSESEARFQQESESRQQEIHQQYGVKVQSLEFQILEREKTVSGLKDQLGEARSLIAV